MNADKIKTIIHEFDPVIYPRKLWIVATSNMRVITDRFLDKESKGEMTYINGDNFSAITQKVTEKGSLKYGVIIIFLSKYQMTTKLIAHEATHAARKIWNELGEDVIGEEANAYLVGWIAECCEKVKLNKK